MKGHLLHGIRLCVVSIYVLLVSVLFCPLLGSVQTAPPTGWRPFSPDSPWNTPIPANVTLDPNSSNYIADFTYGTNNYQLQVNNAMWTCPIYYIDSATPLVTIPIIDNVDPLGGPGYNKGNVIPMPTGAEPDPSTDHDMCLLDYDNLTDWEFTGIQQDPATGIWTTRAGTTWDLTGDGAYNTTTGNPITAAIEGGTPILGGLIRYEELSAGQINHALMVGYCYPAPTVYRYPAASGNGFGTRQYAIPLGALLQLDPSLNLDDPTYQLSASGKVIARALQKYGAYMVTNSDNHDIYAENLAVKGQSWNGLLSLNMLINIPLSSFRVINTSYLLPQKSYSVSGKVTLSSGGAALSGVSLALTSIYPYGNQTGSTSSSGAFSFTHVLNGNYTITPEKIGYDITPSVISTGPSGANVGNVNFTATSNGEVAEYLHPKSVTVTRSFIYSRPLSTLTVEDESGSTFDANNCFGVAPNFDGYFSFYLPSGQSESSVKHLRIDTNMWASNYWQSAWEYQVYNFKTREWVWLDNNATVPSHFWTQLQFDLPGNDMTAYFSSSGELRMHYYTNSNNYGSNLDWLELRVLYVP